MEWGYAEVGYRNIARARLLWWMVRCRWPVQIQLAHPNRSVTVHNDMEPSLRRRRWALLPTFEAFRAIIQLFVYNCNHLPSERRHFTEVSAVNNIILEC